MKTCAICKESLPISAYTKDCTRPDGLRVYCRACQRAFRQRRRARDRELAASAYRARTPVRPTMHDPGTVYTIEINGGIYVGQTANYAQRSSYHLCRLRQGKHYNKALQAAYDASNEDPVFTVVYDGVLKEAREELEQYVIALHADHCFNVMLAPISPTQEAA